MSRSPERTFEARTSSGRPCIFASPVVSGLAAAVALCLLPACDPTLKATDDSDLRDADGDGTPDASDCAPDDPGIRPGADEVCDGVDQDCDGTADDGLAQTGFYDADGDGYGDTTAPSCDTGAAYSAVPGDCDDSNPEIHPEATESCNGTDDDCDGSTDEDNEGGIYMDFDGDGYGDPATATTGCTNSVWTTVSGDCNDHNARISPGAGEICNTVDDDCSGTIDDGGVCPCDVMSWPDADHPYMFCTTAEDWSSAFAVCGLRNYRLVTIDSAEEDAWVQGTILTYTAGPSWWIGFTDVVSEGTWTWSDGSPVSYVNWAPGEPSHGEGDKCVEEDCGVITGSAWQDSPCTCMTLAFVCEGNSELSP